MTTRAPVFAPDFTVNPERFTMNVKLARSTTPGTRLAPLGRAENGNLNGHGNVTTRWRTG